MGVIVLFYSIDAIRQCVKRAPRLGYMGNDNTLQATKNKNWMNIKTYFDVIVFFGRRVNYRGGALSYEIITRPGINAQTS